MYLYGEECDKKIIQTYVKTPLILRIAIGAVIGICLGIVAPQTPMIPVLGEIFVGALKAIAPVHVFVLVIASLANASAGIGKRFRTVVIFYMVSTFLAAVMAVLSSYLFPVTIPLGATINMDGAAITITVLSLSAAFSQGVKVNVLLAILLSFVAILGACGASGVAGGSLLLIPMACSLLA